MTDQYRQKQTCQGCGKPLDSGDGKIAGSGRDLYCRQCLIEQAEKYIEEAAIKTPPLKRLRETTAWKVSLALIVIVCLGIIVYQFPRLQAAFKEPKPVRMGIYVTNTVTDACLKNLWQLASELQQGKKEIAPTIVCPATGKPYDIRPGPNPEIHCPNPEVHGFEDIVVSKKNPVPELKK